MAEANEKNAKDSSYLFILRRQFPPNEESDDTFFVLHDSDKEELIQDSKFLDLLSVFWAAYDDRETSKYKTQKQDNRRIERDCTVMYKYEKDNSFKLSGSTFNIATFTVYLMRFFGVHPNNCISYISNDGAKLPIQSDSDFVEFWKFVKLRSKYKKGVVLEVDFTNKEDLMAMFYDKVSASNNNVSESSKTKENISEVKEIEERKRMEDTYRCTVAKDIYNSKYKYITTEDTVDKGIYSINSNKTAAIGVATSSTDIKSVPHNINANADKDIQNLNDLNNTNKINTSVDFNNSPPKWFKEYMDQLKQDIVTDISRQVISNIMEYFNVHSAKPFIHLQSKNSKEERQYKNKKVNMRKENGEPKQLTNSVQIVAKQEKTELANDIKTTNIEQKKLSQCTTDAMINVDIPDTHNKISTNVNTVSKQAICSSEEPFILKGGTEEILHGKSVLSSSLKCIENELHMKCSVTGHDILNTVTVKDTTYCNESDIDNGSLCSNASANSEVCETCNFEMVHMQQPKCIIIKNPKETFTLGKENNANDEQCSSFEILSEVSSSPLFINIDEHHFSADEGNTLDSSTNIDYFATEKSRVFENINVAYNGSKRETNNPGIMESGNGNFLNIPTLHDRQAQTDTNDLTQSFHSHTASVTDNNNVYSTNATCNSDSYNYGKHAIYDSNKLNSTKENGIIQQIRKEFDNRNSKRNIKENGNIESPNRTTQRSSSSDLSEPVHILPETLVTGAIHVASLAYGTARGAFDKIRFNVKEERSSHVKRGWH